MNRRHPIDHVFRQNLEDYELDPPFHLWAGIEEGLRPARPERQKWPLLLLLLLLIGGLNALSLWNDYRQSLPADRGPAMLPATGVESPPPVAPPVSPTPAFPAATPGAAPATAQAKAPATLPALSPSPVTPLSIDREINELLAVAPPALSAPRPSPQFIDSPPPSLALFTRQPQCVRFAPVANWRFYADVSAGPTLSNRTLHAKSNEFNDYVHARDATEIPQMGFGAAFRFSMVTDFGLAARGGLSYTQLRERFDYTDNSEERITITNIYGPRGDIIGTDTIVETGMRREVAANRYHLLNLPLLIGYEARSGKWTLALSAGPTINLAMRAAGQFIAPDEARPTRFSSRTGDAFRNRVGLGWYAGAGLLYRIDDDLQLQIEPHVLHFPQSLTRDEYVLQQRHLAGGLSIGLRKRI